MMRVVSLTDPRIPPISTESAPLSTFPLFRARTICPSCAGGWSLAARAPPPREARESAVDPGNHGEAVELPTCTLQDGC